jgi:phosphohistidine phosphatase SixA
MKSNEENFLFVSHANQIRSFLNKTFGRDKFQKYIYNGAILLLKIDPNFTTVELLYRGHDSPTNYYTEKTFPKSKVRTKKVTSRPIKKNICIYLVRHGISEHNIYPRTKEILRKKDTVLTEKGRKEIRFSRDYLPVFSKLFATSLLRSRQTVVELLKYQRNKPKVIYILPNVKEIQKGFTSFLPNIPDEKNRNLPKTFVIDWSLLSGKSTNFIDAIIEISS